MKLQFFGAARTVTGSCHLLEVGKSRILLDCGLYQGRRKEAFHRNRNFAFDPSAIDALVLSHAHIDHSGNIPHLVKSGFKGKIFATTATHDLCEWMLRDSAYIQEKDVEYVNRKRRKKGQSPFEPLYTKRDAELALKRFIGIEYERPVEVAPGVTLRLEDAGHILGSASCHLDCEERDRKLRVVFTGDIGVRGRPILRDPVPPTKADYLICESTYGDRLHEPPEKLANHLLEVFERTRARGGRVLIPAFSVGRTQHIVYVLNELWNSGKLPPMPVFVDSPLACNATDVFRDHPECYDEEAFSRYRNDDDLFGFHRLTYIRDVEASKALNELHVPCVIISASGMCEAGRVLHHLKRVAPDPKSTILVVGYMAPFTLGRRIADRAPRVKLFGDTYPLKAEVVSTSGFSGHADRDGLLDYLGHLDRPPHRTFLVHGELEQSEAFAEHLRKREFPAVDIPAELARFDL